MSRFFVAVLAFMCGVVATTAVVIVIRLTEHSDVPSSYETRLFRTFVSDDGDKGWDELKPAGGIFFVEDVGKQYEIRVELSVMDGFEYSQIPIEMVITSPSGKIEVQNTFLIIKDEEGNYIGKAEDDVWTVEQIIFPRKEFTEKGEYAVSIHHKAQDSELFKVKSLLFSVASLKKKVKTEK